MLINHHTFYSFSYFKIYKVIWKTWNDSQSGINAFWYCFLIRIKFANILQHWPSPPPSTKKPRPAETVFEACSDRDWFACSSLEGFNSFHLVFKDGCKSSGVLIQDGVPSRSSRDLLVILDDKFDGLQFESVFQEMKISVSNCYLQTETLLKKLWRKILLI